MIASISGILTRIDSPKIILVSSGIGFEMLCPTAFHLKLNEVVQLYVHLHWSAENGPSLYGFEQMLHKDLFLLLIDCQGVGPKLGISILQQTDTTQLLHLIASENTDGLSKVKGLGAKKAELICMHLKDKVAKLMMIHSQNVSSGSLGVWHDLHETLVSLHYSTSEIKQATAMVKESIMGQTLPFDLLLRKTLQVLAKQ